MKKHRLLAIVMAVFMALSLLPSMVFATDAGILLEGRLKIKGLVAVGNELSADYTKVLPEGMTDDKVSFLWSLKTSEEEQPLELSREKTYKVAESDLGYKIILKITGLAEMGYGGELEVTSYAVQATKEEAEVLAAQAAAEEAALEAALQESVAEEVIVEETPVEEVSEEITEELYPEDTETLSEEGYSTEETDWDEELLEIPEPDEDYDETYAETLPEEELVPVDEATDSSSGTDSNGEEWTEEIGDEELFEITVSSSNEEVYSSEGTDAGAVEEPVYLAQAETADGSGVLDFGTITDGEESEVEEQYLTVTNTGNSTLNFEGISPTNFMVQDIVDPLQPGESVTLWIQPRESVTAGSYEDMITYTSFEGATATVIAKVFVEEAVEIPDSSTDNTQEENVEEASDNLETTPTDGAENPGTTPTEGAENPETTPTGEAENPETTPTDGAENPETTPTGEAENPETTPTGEAENPETTPTEGAENPETTPSGDAEDPETTPSVDPVISAQINPTEIVFDTVEVGYGEIGKTEVTVTNTGNTAFTIGNVIYQNANGEALTESANFAADKVLTGVSVNANESLTFQIGPKTELGTGSHEETLILYNQDGTELAKLALKFQVKEPTVYELSTDQQLKDFGTLEVGYSERPAAQTANVKNTGNATVILQQPTSTNFEVGALSDVELAPGEETSFSIQPKAGLAEGVYQGTIEVKSDKAATQGVEVSFIVTKATIKLEALQKLSEITGLKNGTKKTAEALKLPATIYIRTSSGNLKANVTWDVDGCSYNASSLEKQTFKVSGKVTLPNGIENPKNISLNTSVTVTVNGYTPKTASKENNKISGIVSEGYTTQSRISFTAVGAGMDNTSPRKGDTRYVPLNWTVINTNGWNAAPYTATFGLTQAGSYNLTVVFNEQKYDGSNWVNTGNQDTKKVTFNVAQASVTGVPGQNLTPAALSTDANQKKAVKTGDNTVVIPFVIALVAAVGCIAGVVVYKKKK